MDLPTEIWLQIFSRQNLSCHDLASACRLCTHLLPIARSILYSSVKLHSEMENDSATCTLSLLARNPELASVVGELSLQRFAQSTKSKLPSLLNILALRNMMNLRKLELIGGVFLGESVDAQDEVVEILVKLIGIHDLSVFTDSFNGLGLSLSQLERFKTLRSLSWNGIAMDDSILESLWTILSSSSNTIESISLPFPNGSRQAMNRFFALKFSSLRSLTLGIWIDGGFLPASFSDFLLNHSPTLEHLDLDSDNQLMLYSSLFPKLEPNSLPRLQSLRANIECIRVMMLSGMQFFSSTLTKLVISPGAVEFIRLNAKMMLGSSSDGMLGALKELDFDLSPWNEVYRSDIVEIMQQLENLCGSSLEVWLGKLPSRVWFSAQEMSALFRGFKKLKVINLWKNLEAKSAEVVEDEKEYVCTLASELMPLEEVYIHSEDYPLSFFVQRGEELSLRV